MKKRICLILLIISIFLGCFSCSASAASPFIPTPGLEISQFLTGDTDEAILIHRQDVAHEMAECARELGYPEDCEVIKTAQAEWWSCYDKIMEIRAATSKWDKAFEEYPYATYIWLYCTKTLGYNNYVTAGIMGNIMAECGGGTLDIQYWLYGSRGYYYGMCQWNKTNYPEIRDKDLIAQCDFLAQTIQYEIDTFGYAYRSGYKYADFLQLTSARDAALMFAKTYERCGSGSYTLRQNYAETAYNYFTGLC